MPRSAYNGCVKGWHGTLAPLFEMRVDVLQPQKEVASCPS